ncbi:dioxygenase family protein [Desertihabitans brevis]|nr:class III extradiol ring-cleavage dioxygenase [Desertihabitans brevis]
MTTSPMPVLYLSHGAPPLADDTRWTAELAAWSRELPRPRQVLIVSAHWEQAPLTMSSTRGAELTYDFWGFPRRYYEVRYDAPTAPGLAAEVSALLGGVDVHVDQERGLDHGAYVPLKEMFPDADIPVQQLSMPTLDPAALFELGRALAPLRDQGTLVVGSGFTTHNLSWFDPRQPASAPPPSVSAEFDDWAREAVEGGDVDTLLDFAHRAPAPGLAHPTTEHLAPLFVAMGAASSTGTPAGRTAVDGFWYGMSKRSWTF